MKVNQQAGLQYALMVNHAKHIYVKEMNHVEPQWNAIQRTGVPSKIVQVVLPNQI
jgi:hypothetical protein